MSTTGLRGWGWDTLSVVSRSPFHNLGPSTTFTRTKWSRSLRHGGKVVGEEDWKRTRRPYVTSKRLGRVKEGSLVDTHITPSICWKEREKHKETSVLPHPLSFTLHTTRPSTGQPDQCSRRGEPLLDPFSRPGPLGHYRWMRVRVTLSGESEQGPVAERNGGRPRTGRCRGGSRTGGSTGTRDTWSDLLSCTTQSRAHTRDVFRDSTESSGLQ